jgi:hypothetical protein
MNRSRYLSAWILQLLGVLLLIGFSVWWALTGHESALLVGAAISLIGLGAYQGVRVTVQIAREEPPPKPPEDPS